MERLATPSDGLNAALGGGIGYGRQTLLWGNKSAGKTSVTLAMIAEAQRAGKVCAFVDAEGTFDAEWAAHFGVDLHNLYVSKTKTIAGMAETVVDFMEAGFGFVVVDSISALIPDSYLVKDSEELKDFSGTKQIGSFSKDLAAAQNMINYSNKDTALVLISQVRNAIGTWGAKLSPQGGKAVEHFSSTIIRFWSSPTDDKQIKGEVKAGDRLITENIGRKVTWTVDYNKIGPSNRSGDYDFYYAGDFIGIDRHGEFVDLAEKYGIITRKSAWYTVDGKQLQGKAAVVAYLKENDDIYQKLVSQVE